MYIAKRFSVITLCASLAVFAVLVFSVAANAQSMSAQMHRWKLLPEPERLTELYFANHASLPTTYVPGQSQTIGLVIHNLQGHNVAYTYTVTQLAPDTQPTVLATGHFTLPNGQYYKPTMHITPVDAGNSQIQVALSPGGEIINYWTTRGQ